MTGGHNGGNILTYETLVHAISGAAVSLLHLFLGVRVSVCKYFHGHKLESSGR